MNENDSYHAVNPLHLKNRITALMNRYLPFDKGELKLWYFRSPRLIVFGENALDHLEELPGTRVFIVTDNTIAKLGYLDRVAEKLKSTGKEVAHYQGVIPEPPDVVVYECVEAMKKFKPDLVIGLGGGSVLDVAKVARILYEHPEKPIIEITPLDPIIIKKTILVAIPTTSGTGSDATTAAVITDSDAKNKMELTSSELQPLISILDPSLTMTLPPSITASTAMDAIAQAIDAYTVQWRNDFSDALAIHSIKMFLKYLPRVYANPDDTEAREKLHNAATISGLAFSNAFLGITHSFGHAMGGLYKMPHGVAVGMVLPYSIEYALKTHSDLYGELAREVGVASQDDDDVSATLKLRDITVNLLKKMKMPRTLKAYGITEKKFKETFQDLCRMTEESAVNILNCREPTNEDIRRIWQYMFEGKSIDF